MLVSVVIPLWNKEAYIARAIRSVLGQSHRDIEILVINDGSTDDSVNMVRSFSDTRITIVNQVNAGPGIARNTGLFKAKGDYIAFLDADDFWHSEFIKTALTLLQQHDAIVTVAVGWSINGTWKNNRQRWLDHGVANGVVRIMPDWDVERMAWHVSYMHSSSTLSKRQALLDIGGFCPHKGELYGEDRYLWINVLLNHSIFIDQGCYVLFDRSASALSSDSVSKPPLAYLTHAEELLHRCPEAYLVLLRRFILREFRLSVRNWAMQGSIKKALYLCRSLTQNGAIDKRSGIASILQEMPKALIKGAVGRHGKAIIRLFQKGHS